MTHGIGVDRAVDAVGVDAQRADSGPASKAALFKEKEFSQQVDQIAIKTNPKNGNWVPGNAPAQVLEWAVSALAKAGTLAVIGVYPETMKWFPIGNAMMKNLTVQGGNCNHRKYLPKLVDLVQNGTVNPSRILTQTEPLGSVIDAYKAFDLRREGWIKVELIPSSTRAAA
jgi:threonine dehydrogenase-like Zn-dependent dehydrogenase